MLQLNSSFEKKKEKKMATGVSRMEIREFRFCGRSGVFMINLGRGEEEQ